MAHCGNHTVIVVETIIILEHLFRDYTDNLLLISFDLGYESEE